MGDILGCNNPDRRDLAHDYLEPHSDGSVSLQKPGQSQRPWTNTDFNTKTKKMKDLTNELRTASTDLIKLVIPVPSGWMLTDALQPPPRRFSPAELHNPILPKD